MTIADSRVIAHNRSLLPSGRTVFAVFVLALAVVVASLILYPLGRALIAAFIVGGAPTFEPFRELAATRGIGIIVENTAIYTAGTVVMAGAMGAFLAWATERTDARMEWLTGILPILPLMMPPIGSALGYLILFLPQSGIGNIALRTLLHSASTSGPINISSFAALIVVSAFSFTPFVYLIVGAAFRNIDPALDEASRLSFASPLRTLIKVTLPLVSPALTSAALLVAIHAMSNFTFPFIIGTGAGVTTTAVYIYRLFAIYPPHQNVAIALSVCMLAVVYAGLYFQLRVTRSLKRSIIAGKHSRAAPMRLGHWRWPVRVIFLLYLIGVILPLIGLVIGSLQPFIGARPSAYSLHNFARVLGQSEVRGALFNSIMLGAAAATLNTLVAALLIYAGTRMLRHGQVIIEGALMIPAIIPHIVLAAAFIITFSTPPFNLYGTRSLILLAYCVMFMPEASRATSAALSQAGQELAEASYVSGAGTLRTLRKIIVPQIMNGLMAGWVIVFFLAVNEVTASSFLGGLNSNVVGHLAVDYFSDGRLPELSTLALIVTIFTATVVLLASTTIRRAYVAKAGSV